MLFVDFEGNFATVNEFTEVGCVFQYHNTVNYFHSYIWSSVPPNKLALIKTGITPQLTENAPSFQIVHDSLMNWLSSLQQLYNFDWKTILPVSFDVWDREQWMLHLLNRNMSIPVWMLHWCDIRILVANKYNHNDLHCLSLQRAARLVDVPFDMKRQHSAIHDAEVCMFLSDKVRVYETHKFSVPPDGIRCF